MHEVNTPPFRRHCSGCDTLFWVQSLVQDGVVPPDVIACPKCGQRWRETQRILDSGRLLTIQEEVGGDTRLTTRCWIEDGEPLEDRYHNRCIRLADELHVLLGAPRTRFLRMIGEHGAVDATKRLIHNQEPSPTFTDLFMKRRLGLTVEAVISTESEWDPLFSDQDRAAAKKRLLDHRWSPSG